MSGGGVWEVSTCPHLYYFFNLSLTANSSIATKIIYFSQLESPWFFLLNYTLILNSIGVILVCDDNKLVFAHKIILSTLSTFIFRHYQYTELILEWILNWIFPLELILDWILNQIFPLKFILDWILNPARIDENRRFGAAVGLNRRTLHIGPQNF